MRKKSQDSTPTKMKSCLVQKHLLLTILRFIKKLYRLLPMKMKPLFQELTKIQFQWMHHILRVLFLEKKCLF